MTRSTSMTRGLHALLAVPGATGGVLDAVRRQASECRPGPVTLPALAGPSGSETFSGAGNLAPTVGKQEVKGVKKASPKPLTRAQKLTNALKACRKDHPHSKSKRKACEARARKLYGPAKKKAGAQLMRRVLSIFAGVLVLVLGGAVPARRGDARAVVAGGHRSAPRATSARTRRRKGP